MTNYQIFMFFIFLKKSILNHFSSFFRVGCLSCDFQISRDQLQTLLLEINTLSLNSAGKQAPDADVMIPEREVKRFRFIDCPQCGGILKPSVTFFGDNVSPILKNFLIDKLSSCDALLAIGSTLQVYSSFRFILAAKERDIPIAILNIGSTRGDPYAQLKLNCKAGDILPKLSFPWKQ